MALPNPWYINQDAIHQPSTIRTLTYGMTTGMQGVWGNDDLKVTALATPGNRIQVAPGGFTVRATHLGGSYESYGGKIDVAEVSDTISPTGSGGGRHDLVILRVENPWVSGAGSWSVPADPANGPYARIVVIEDVGPTVWDVRQYNNTWSAITLAKIYRPANTNVVTPEHITNARSIAALGGTRTVYVEAPPVTLPPIEQAVYMDVRESAKDSNYPSSDTVHNYWTANSQWQDWPSAATWQVPVPSWARQMDIDMQIYNAQNLHNDVFAQLAMNVNGARLSYMATVAIDYVQQPARFTLPYAVSAAVPETIRGKVVTFRPQMKSYFTFTDNSGRRFDAKGGTVSRLLVNFQRNPDL